VIWSQDAYDRELNAYEIPDASCGIGGKAPPGSASGRVYDDVNGNGIPDGGEPPLAGATVFVDKNDNGTRDDGEPSTTSADNGTWKIENVDPGSYKIRSTRVNGYVCSAPADCTYSASVKSGSDTGGLDFGQRVDSKDQKSCPDTRDFEFKFYRSSRHKVRRFRVVVDGKKVADTKGKDLKGYKLAGIPQKDGVVVVIILDYNTKTRIKSTRVYNSCGKTLPSFERSKRD
jgi:SdrD B-like domain